MLYEPNMVHVNQLLQNVDVNITTSRNTAIDDIASDELVIPEILPVNMLVILRPGKEKLINEKFWLGILFCYLFLFKKILTLA